MPKILIWKNIVFLIFSVDIRESRRHIHVVKKSVNKFYPAKFWLEPTIEIAEKGDFTNKEINKIHDLIVNFETDLHNQLTLFYKGEPVKAIKK